MNTIFIITYVFSLLIAGSCCIYNMYQDWYHGFHIKYNRIVYNIFWSVTPVFNTAIIGFFLLMGSLSLLGALLDKRAINGRKIK